jgi:hypothetical protein
MLSINYTMNTLSFILIIKYKCISDDNTYLIKDGFIKLGIRFDNGSDLIFINSS